MDDVDSEPYKKYAAIRLMSIRSNIFVNSVICIPSFLSYIFSMLYKVHSHIKPTHILDVCLYYNT